MSNQHSPEGAAVNIILQSHHLRSDVKVGVSAVSASPLVSAYICAACVPSSVAGFCTKCPLKSLAAGSPIV